MGGLVKVLGPVSFPETCLGLEAQKLRGACCVELVHRVLVDSQNGVGSEEGFGLLVVEGDREAVVGGGVRIEEWIGIGIRIGGSGK